MTPKLEDALSVALPLLPEELVDGSARASIRQLARNLPPVVRTLLECRLDASQSQVDLSQSFLVGDQPELIALLSEVVDTPSWNGLAEFFHAWSSPGTLLAETIEGAWLEFDLDPATSAAMPLPGLFLSFKSCDNDAPSVPRIEAALEQVSNMVLGRNDASAMIAKLLRCIDALPPRATPTYVGYMTSRADTPLRAQFSGISHSELVSYLGRIGLGPASGEIHQAIEIAHTFFETSVLCIDLMPEVGERVGFELFPSSGRNKDDLAPFLDRLVDLGICSPVKRTALESWPGRMDPTNAPAPWPDHLIIESLRRPADQFSVLDRRINHFKLVCQPDRHIEAKVYLALDHHWAEFELDGSSVS